MKKLEKTPWMPRIMSVAAGISRRRFSSVDGSRPKWACCQSHSARRNKIVPASNTTRPATIPFSSVKILKTRVSFGSSGSRPSAMAKTLVKNANATSWKPDDDRHARHHQRADVQLNAADFDILHRQRGGKNDSQRREQKPRHEKQPARREKQHEPQMPPAVAPRLQVRRARAPVRVQA